MTKIITLQNTERNTHIQMLIDGHIAAQWPFITPAQAIPLVLSESLKMAVSLRYDFGCKKVVIKAKGEIAKYLSDVSSVDPDEYAITIN